MALIFRSIVEVEADDFVGTAPELFLQWVRRKLRDELLEVPADGETHELRPGLEAAAVEASEDGTAAYRARLYEKRAGEEVKTTFTALGNHAGSWAWVDLERWAEDAWRSSWVPYSPGIVSHILAAGRCSRGSNGLDNTHHVLEGDQGALLASQVLHPEREVPIVVVTPTSREREEGLSAPTERAKELQRRLAGIAPVYLLAEGAVTAFSKGMLAAPGQMDVHSGAVRTYLPGAGGDRDMPWRHRYVAFHRLAKRPPDTAARLVSLPLMRAASHQSPPPLWRVLREHPELSGAGLKDGELVELVDLAEEERGQALTSAQEAEARANEAEAGLELERETQAELLKEREDLVRRLRYAEGRLRERGDTPQPPSEDEVFAPDLCEEVVEYAEAHLDRIVLGERVREGAEQLDLHSEASWARKAYRALDALHEYATAKAQGAAGNFFSYCESGESLSVVPTSWLSIQESETTDQNPRFRALRTFAVDEMVDRSGSVYMPSHIKLEKGGNPAPRIHFYDDSAGATGKIHVGWLGPHLDNKSKS